MPKISRTDDGWLIANDPQYIEYLIAHPPPRKWTIWNQIVVDSHSKLILTWWIIGAASFAISMATGHWIVSIVGLFLYIRWYWLCRLWMKTMRNGQVRNGVIIGRKPHPFFSLASASEATLPDGSRVDVAICQPLDSMISLIDDEAYEVLFIDNSKSTYQSALAIREITAEPSHHKPSLTSPTAPEG